MSYIQRILRKSDFFNPLEPTELEALVNCMTRLDIPAGGMIAKEGDVGKECYVVLEGDVQVFSITKGQEIVLARRGVGEVIGEQALLPNSTGRRNASLRAYSDVTLLQISKQDFQAVLLEDNPLKEKLLKCSEEQLQNSLLRQSKLFGSLPFKSEATWYRLESFADGAIIFHQGDPPDRVYLITSGKADVFEEDGDTQKLVLQLGLGRTFGERALIERVPRSATVIAHGVLKTISIDGKHFLELSETNPDVRQYMQTLKKVYLLAGKGFTTQYIGKFLDQDCLTTVSSLIDGSVAISSLVIGQDIFNMNISLSEGVKVEKICYYDKGKSIERELLLARGQVVGVTSKGYWSELGRLYRQILEESPLQDGQLKLFKEKGIIWSEIPKVFYKNSETVCHCMQISCSELLTAIGANCKTISDLMDATGAGTICGSCRPILHEMIDEGSWIPVHVFEEVPVAEEIRSFRLKPQNGKLSPAKPGQHIVIQAHIDGKWVQRPYTISSAAQETSYYEITMKREPQGFFSNWMFAGNWRDAIIRTSKPQGEYFADLGKSAGIVCLVGGIGVTPSLAMCRSAIRASYRGPLHVDYSAQNEKQLAYAKEFKEAADRYKNIKINLRITNRDSHLQAADIKALVAEYPEAHFYICGPKPYQLAIERYLDAARVPTERINIEEFKAVSQEPVQQNRGYFYLGLFLLVAFALQDALGLKIPEIESLQVEEAYRHWSGLALTLYIAAQFILPLMRLCSKTKTTVRQYRIHKWQGALAPLIYYFHATGMGYAYLLFLSYVYFANFLLGLFNHELIGSKQKKYYSFYWLTSHVVLSLLSVALIAYHIYVVFAYK